VLAEAVLYAAGLGAFHLRWPGLQTWLKSGLLALLGMSGATSLFAHLTRLRAGAAGPCAPVVQRRAAWTTARFVADFGPDVRCVTGALPH
jgi:hypothetical protein